MTGNTADAFAIQVDHLLEQIESLERLCAGLDEGGGADIAEALRECHAILSDLRDAEAVR